MASGKWLVAGGLLLVPATRCTFMLIKTHRVAVAVASVRQSLSAAWLAFYGRSLFYCFAFNDIMGRIYYFMLDN